MNININLNVTNNGVEVGEVEYGCEPKEQKIEVLSFKDFFKKHSGFDLTETQEQLYEIFELKHFRTVAITVPRRSGISTFFHYYQWYKTNMEELKYSKYETLHITPFSRWTPVDKNKEENKNLKKVSLSSAINHIRGCSYNLIFFEDMQDFISKELVSERIIQSLCSLKGAGTNKIVCMNLPGRLNNDFRLQFQARFNLLK